MGVGSVSAPPSQRRFTDMLFINRLLMVGLLSVGIAVATTAQAGNQLFEGSWSVKSFGNECSKAASSPAFGPHCGGGEVESLYYTGFGMPQGILCHANQPRCPFVSTPTDGLGVFAALGGNQTAALFCKPWANWQGGGTSARPAKGGTAVTTAMKPGDRIPPLYRNTQFFTSGGQPDTQSCYGTSTGATPGGKGLVQAGNPVTGVVSAATTANGAFTFAAAPATGTAGVRATGVVGSFGATYPYVYSYTYANLKNEMGIFGPGKGPGDFSLARQDDGIYMKQGAAKFGGTMTMLGAITSKVCYYRNGGCSLGEGTWRYEMIGTSASTSGGVVTAGYVVTAMQYYYHSALMQVSKITVEASRFPWGTGSLTLTATGRGPHKTVLYTQGFDNRTTTSGKGTIQMVTPVITRWLQPALKFETGGVGILRIRFVPEPQTWAMLFAGVSLLGVGYRMRGR
jgi:hypothetical protein